MCKISIIIPVYNLENHIRRCLDSIYIQNTRDIEVICIDDGSTDKSLNILQDYAQKYSNMHVINQENQGVSVARNAGLSFANGEYILFVDGDDYLECNSLQSLKENVNGESPDLVFFDYRIIATNNFIFSSRNVFNNENKMFYFNEQIESCCLNLNITNCMINKLFKKDFITNNNIKFLNGCKYGEDSLFIMSFLAFNPKIKTLNKILYNVIERTDSATRGISRKTFIDGFEDFLKYFDKLILILPLNPSLFAYTLDKVFSVIIYDSWRVAYFENYKKIYLNIIDDYIQRVSTYSKEIQNNLHGYKNIQKELNIAKYHLSWLYWKILFPIGKYCIVLPCRNIKSWLRSKNGK